MRSSKSSKKSDKLTWRTEKRRVKTLIPFEGNPRQMNVEQRFQLEQSLRKFDLVEIPAIDTDGKIIAGHQRVEILNQIGRGNEEIEVRVPNRKLTTKEFREYNLRSNKNTGEWDFEKLADFNPDELLGVGFTTQELDKIFNETDEDDFDAEAEAAKIIKPQSKLGDIYKLGEHILICGDATDPKYFKFPGKGDMAFTDPPYNVNYSGEGKKTRRKIEGDHQAPEQFREFLKKSFQNLQRAMKPASPVYVCYAIRTHREFEDSLNAAGYQVRNQIIWVKKVASMGWGDYRWKHEPILYCVPQEESVSFYGDRSQYTEWTDEPSDEELLQRVKKMITKEESGGSTVWRFHRDSNYEHPTQKPVALCKTGIVNSSKRGDTVIDLFGGSGSTLMACDKLARKCFMMEIDPKFTDVIIKRWSKKSKKEAQKIA